MTKPPPDLEKLAPLREKYQFLEILGSGGFGVVYRGIQRELQRPVAIKLLVRGDAAGGERFVRESKALGLLHHPAIVEVIEAGDCVGVPYIVMAFAEGQTVKDRLDSTGPFPPDQVVEIAQTLLEALQHIHTSSLVHRDIKPTNILITPEGKPKLIDFGISLHTSWHRLTETGAWVGTPLYMAPEQLVGEDLDGRSDLYSLGLVLFEMLYAKSAIQGETIPAVTRGHLALDALVLPATPELPAGLRRLLTGLLRRRPADRVQSGALGLALLDPEASPADRSETECSRPEPTRRLDRAAGASSVLAAGPAHAAGLVGMLLLLLVALWMLHNRLGTAPRLVTRLNPADRHLSVRVEPPCPGTLLLAAPDGTAIQKIPVPPTGLVNLTNLPRFPQLNLSLSGARGEVLAKGSITTPTLLVTIWDLAVVAGQDSAIVDFEFSGPEPSDISVDGHAARLAPAIPNTLLTPHHRRVVLLDLTPGTPHRLDIGAPWAWGGVRGHRFWTMTRGQHEAHQDLLAEVTRAVWPAAIPALEMMRKDPDPQYVGPLREKLRAKEVGDPLLVQMVAGVLARLRDPIGSNLLLPTLTRLASMPVAEQSRILRYLGDTGDARLPDACRRFIRDAHLPVGDPDYVRLLLVKARDPVPQDAAELLAGLEQRQFKLNDAVDSALFRTDPTALSRWCKARLAQLVVPYVTVYVLGNDPGPAEVDLLRPVIPDRIEPRHLNNAMRMLVDFGPIAAPLATRALEKHPQDPGCIWACGALGAKAAVPVLERTLGNVAVPSLARQSAALALGLIGDRSVVPALEATLVAGPKALSRASAWSLGRLEAVHVVPHLEKLAANWEDSSDTAIWALGRIGSASATELLRALIAYHLSPKDLAEESRLGLAVWALSRLGTPADHQALFQRVLGSNPAPFVRRQAVKGLALAGTSKNQLEHFCFPFVFLDRPGLEAWPEEEVQMVKFGDWGYRVGERLVVRRPESRAQVKEDDMALGGFVGHQTIDPSAGRLEGTSVGPTGRREVLLSTQSEALTFAQLKERDWVGVVEVVLTCGNQQQLLGVSRTNDP